MAENSRLQDVASIGKENFMQPQEAIPKWSTQVTDRATLEGSFLDGVLHGIGKVSFHSGQSSLFGEFRKGKLQGVGRETIKEDRVMEGFFRDGSIYGPGKIVTYSKNEKITGYFSATEDGESHLNGFGKVVALLPSGSQYMTKAIFENNVANSIGKEFTENCVYEGTFSASVKSGVGRMIYDRGNTVIIARFGEGEIVDYFIKKGKDGTLVEGDLLAPEGRKERSFRVESQDKKILGSSSLAFIKWKELKTAQGNTSKLLYKGQIIEKSLEPHGKGILISEEGIFKGIFEHGKRHGKGMLLRSAEEDYLLGEWVEDQLRGTVLSVHKRTFAAKAGVYERGVFCEKAGLVVDPAMVEIIMEYKNFEDKTDRHINEIENYLKSKTEEIVEALGELNFKRLDVAERMLESDIQSVEANLASVEASFARQAEAYRKAMRNKGVDVDEEVATAVQNMLATQAKIGSQQLGTQGHSYRLHQREDHHELGSDPTNTDLSFTGWGPSPAKPTASGIYKETNVSSIIDFSKPNPATPNSVNDYIENYIHRMDSSHATTPKAVKNSPPKGTDPDLSLIKNANDDMIDVEAFNEYFGEGKLIGGAENREVHRISYDRSDFRLKDPVLEHSLLDVYKNVFDYDDSPEKLKDQTLKKNYSQNRTNNSNRSRSRPQSASRDRKLPDVWPQAFDLPACVAANDTPTVHDQISRLTLQTSDLKETSKTMNTLGRKGTEINAKEKRKLRTNQDKTQEVKIPELPMPLASSMITNQPKLRPSIKDHDSFYRPSPPGIYSYSNSESFLQGLNLPTDEDREQRSIFDEINTPFKGKVLPIPPSVKKRDIIIGNKYVISK